MPVPDYDNLLVGQYIRAIENPDSVGFKNGMWFQSPRRADDPNNRGFGVDIKYNDKASRLAAGRPGKYLTEQEERNLRNAHIRYSQNVLDKWTPKMLEQIPSEAKQAMATGMIYRGDGVKKIIKTPALRDAYYGGTDDEFQQAVEDYYKSKRLPERAKNHTQFIETHTTPSILQSDWSKTSTAFKPVLAEGGFLQPQDAWNKLSMAEKAEMMKVAVRNGIYNLSDIRAKYNEFAEGGNIYDGKSESTQKMNTTGGAGYVPPVVNPKAIANSIRSRAYKTINPFTDYNIRENLEEFLVDKSIDYGDIKQDENGKLWTDFEDSVGDVGIADELWAKYLQIPEKDRRFKARMKESSYRPQMGGNMNLTYYKLPLTSDERDNLIEETNDLPIGKNKVSDIFSGYNLADHTVGRGYDSKGEYRSYYDRWDINPFNGKYQGTNIPFLNVLQDASFGIGKPVNVYDRIYLGDYYGVPQSTHATWLPEVTVYSSKAKTPYEEILSDMERAKKVNKHSIGGPLVEAVMNEYKSGGSIHIKPENRGKFTALKKRTGHSASWFKAHGTPAQKKMAVFALNARKWKHGLGGPLVENLFYPGGGMGVAYGKPFYSYDDNGKLILDKNGKPTLNYIATPPLQEIVVTPDKNPVSIDRLVKGVNTNSNYTVGDYARKAGKAAAREVDRKSAEAAARYNSHNEMYSMKPVKEVSGEIVYRGTYDPKVIGLSPVDPIGEFFIAGEALEPLFKPLFGASNTLYKATQQLTDLPISDGKYWTTQSLKEALKRGNSFFNKDVVPRLRKSREGIVEERLLQKSPYSNRANLKTLPVNVAGQTSPIILNKNGIPYTISLNKRNIASFNDRLNTIIHEMREDMTHFHKGLYTEENQEALKAVQAYEEAVKGSNWFKAMRLFPKYRKYLKQLEEAHKELYLTPEEKNIIESAYKIPQKPSIKNSDKLNEKVAENTSYREEISRRNGNVVGAELDAVIDKMSDNEVLEILSSAKSYGKDYRKYIEENPKLQKQMIQNIKNAMKKVGVFTGATAVVPDTIVQLTDE